MNRKELRQKARSIIDEYTEEPEGLFKDETSDEFDLNEMINESQEVVHLDLIQEVPQLFMDSFTISLTANKGKYSIETDFSTSDLMMIENIYVVKSGERRRGLIYLSYDQFIQIEEIGEKREPEFWTRLGLDNLVFRPIPNKDYSNIYECFYFPSIPELNEDTTHNPGSNQYAIPRLPKYSHKLIPYDVARQCHLIAEEEQQDLNRRYMALKSSVVEKLLSIAPSVTTKRRLSLKEQIGIDKFGNRIGYQD